jgi:prepilin-type N-terminal cleavage/methylation domain-containing protein
MNLFKFGKSSKGFTLIELLIVIAIIGILAAALLVALNPGQRIAAARNSRVRSDIVNLGNDSNLFNTDSGLNTACLGGGSYPSASGQAVCGARFVAIPNDPAGTQYEFAVTPAGCAPNTATPCTAIEFDGPVYADGVITQAQVNANPRWCWRSASGTITQTTQAGCTP